MLNKHIRITLMTTSCITLGLVIIFAATKAWALDDQTCLSMLSIVGNGRDGRGLADTCKGNSSGGCTSQTTCDVYGAVSLSDIGVCAHCDVDLNCACADSGTVNSGNAQGYCQWGPANGGECYCDYNNGVFPPPYPPISQIATCTTD